MAEENFINYNLPTDAYLNFDADSFKAYMIEKLNQNDWFVDQNFTGSNLNNLLDIIAYSNNTLLFYLNQTSKESLFSEADLYENINRIVKLIGYNPTGYVASILSFTATSTLDAGNYSIPRYSYFNIDGVSYSFIEDGVFVKQVDGEETLDDFNESHLLYNGKYEQLPDYPALGIEGELIELSTKDKNIDRNTINVYVKTDGVWSEWTQVEDLYFSGFSDAHFSIRLNENENYEITFGNGINGKVLTSGDTVSVFYLNSDGESGQVTEDYLKGDITFFSSSRMSEILEDIKGVTYITQNEASNISFINDLPSTQYSEREDVEDIRENAPIFYQSQNRLISKDDFTSFIKNNYGGIIGSVKVVNNRNFLESHIAYLSKIGVVNPFEDGRVLTNQYFFSTPCNFNNVYIYAVPRVEQKYSTLKRLNYINPLQKQAIIDAMDDKKEISLDIIIHDPVYMAVDIGISTDNSDPVLGDISDTKLNINMSSNNFDSKSVAEEVTNIFKEYFTPDNFELGQLINIQTITNEILNISGVSSITTSNGDRVINGVNLYVWDVVYDTNYSSTSTKLQVRRFSNTHSSIRSKN